MLAAVAGIYAYYEMDKDAETAADKSSDYTLTADEVMSQFESDVEAAHAKFNNKTIEISGVISEIEFNDNRVDVVLETEDPMSNINIQLIPVEEKSTFIKVGDSTTLKAFYQGVNEELGIDVELNQGVKLN